MNAHISYSATVPAAPPRVYRVISDYRHHHPAIVPKDVFRRVEVQRGGVGAGTRFQPILRWMMGSFLTGIYRREVALIARYIAEDRGLKDSE